MNNNKLLYIDAFRALAILIVVAGHTLIFGKGLILQLTASLYGMGAFMFIFIAGFLFQYNIEHFNYHEYLKKRFLNVISPYLCILIPVAFLFIYTASIVSNPFYYLPKFIQIPTIIVFGNIINPPTWFVLLIAVYYLLAPVFVYLEKKQILWKYVLPILIVYTLLLGRVSGLKFHYAVANIEILHTYWAYFWFSLSSILSCLSYYVLGMFCCYMIQNHKNIIEKNNNKLICSTFILYIIFSIFCIWFPLASVKFNISFYWLILVTRIIIINFLILFLFYKFSIFFKKNNFINNSIKTLSKYSYGIFLIHYYIINLFLCGNLYLKCGYPYKINIYQNLPKIFLFTIFLFLISLFGSILILKFTKFLLNKFGISNSKKIIGV